MAEKTTSTVVLGIEGMTCSSCVSRVEKSLGELPGVHAAVNLATNSAKVEYPEGVSAEDLVKQVSKIGYTATLPAAAANQAAAAGGGRGGSGQP